VTRYFFDIRDGVQIIDDHGQECSYLDAARLEALSRLTAKMREEIGLWTGAIWSVIVRDENEKTVASIVFSAN
jgi:predicted house-cleaning noncanonical NTP pyrophosphatase (MazG superfamily)